MASRLYPAIPIALAILLLTAPGPGAEYNTAVKQAPLTTWTAGHSSDALARQQHGAIAKQVDKLLGDDLAASISGGKPTPVGERSKDEIFVRRVYLDLVGRNPAPSEVTAFSLDPSPGKRAKLVDRLLDDPGFGENWGRYWRDVIMYRRSDERAQLAAQSLFEYLRDQFNKNAPWDEIARSFITAIGDVRENGATGLMMAQNGNTAEITSEVARIFMGTQIQCANCHAHKTDRLKATQFHELASIF